MLKQFLPAIRITLFFTALTGLVYPAVVTALSQILFRDQAHGSLVLRGGQPAGSVLLGQSFTRPEYFHARPSAAGANGYDGGSSSGSNLGPTSEKLFYRVRLAEEQFRRENPDFQNLIPADALTTSGSGLDPHISPATALAQIRRVARARRIDAITLRQLVDQFTEGRTLGLLGEPRVNVLLINMALDEKFPVPK